MTALLRILRFVLAVGTPSETNFVRLIEVLCAVVVTVNLAAAWTHDPEPVTEDVSWLCWSSHLNCRAMAHEARAQAMFIRRATAHYRQACIEGRVLPPERLS